MHGKTSLTKPRGLARVFGWRRLLVALCASVFVSLLIYPGWEAGYPVLIGRLYFVALLTIVAFGIFERWPAHLPRWLARWALQVSGVALVIPPGVFVVYVVTTLNDPVFFWHEELRKTGFLFMNFMGLLLAPWIALSALLRQVSGEARHQALTFELERSELERKALDARLRLLQAQVEPHFLFNTLANVRELVEGGSPQAATVLGSLIAYLRAAVPRLNEPASTLFQELELVRAYLEVMHMRMPDRLQFEVYADESVCALRCPPMTLLTLVENAVRHGIDPSEKGGQIEVRVSEHDGQCFAQVSDTGVGLRRTQAGLGTGLSNLRERLQLFFGHDAELQITSLAPHGVRVELHFPVQRDPV